MVHGGSNKLSAKIKKLILAESLLMFVHTISYMCVDGKSRKFSISLFNEFLGWLYATAIWMKLELL